MSPSLILERCVNYSAKGLVVITGGEPFRQDIGNLVNTLVNFGYYVQIETNGDFLRAGMLPGAIIVVSPKASMRGYTNPPAGMIERADYMKFVVTADEDSLYHELPGYAFQFANLHGMTSLYVSPMNEYKRNLNDGEVASMWSGAYDLDKCALNNSYAAKLALLLGCSLSLQTHSYVSVL